MVGTGGFGATLPWGPAAAAGGGGGGGGGGGLFTATAGAAAGERFAKTAKTEGCPRQSVGRKPGSSTSPRATPPECRTVTPLEIVQDAKEFLSLSRSVSPLQPRRRALLLDHTRLPFEEPEALLPNRLPSLSSGAGKPSGAASSAPPTRGPAGPLSPLRLPSPPGTDPPRRERKKKKKPSSSVAGRRAPAVPDSPLPLPPSLAKPLCGSLSTQAGETEEFPPAPAGAEGLVEPLLCGTPASLLAEEELEVVCVHGAVVAARGRPAPRTGFVTPGRESAGFVRLGQENTDYLEDPAVLDASLESVVVEKLAGHGCDDLRGGGSISTLDPSGMDTPSTFLGQGFAGARGTPSPDLTPMPPPCPETPPDLLRARTDCDYWDAFSQTGSSRAYDSVDGREKLCQRSPGGLLTSFSPPQSPKPKRSTQGNDVEVMRSMDRDDIVRGECFSWVRGELVGRGSLGYVWKALNRSTGQLMAVKEIIFDTRDQADDRFRTALQNEIDLYKDLEHPHIVSYLGNDYLSGRLYIYLEYMPGGSIAQVLSQFGPLDEPLMARYAHHLLEGLEYLHTRSPPVLHRDIKGANILVGLDRQVKLSDFGCSKRSAGTMVHTLRGSVPWMAPEVMRQSSYGRKADVWSLGCVLIEMSTASAPWGSFDNHLAAMVRIALSEETPPVPGHLSAACRDLVALCTRRAPEERPSATQLLAHEFVAGYLSQSAIDESWEP